MNLINRTSLFLLLSVIAVSCANGDKGTRTETKTPVNVGVMIASETDSQTTESYVGQIQASKSVVLSALHMGNLSVLNVSQGSVVTKGDVLAEINSKNVKTTYEISHATLKQAEDGYKRVRQVYESGTVPDVKMVEIETQLAKAKAAAESSAQSLEECKIKAPFSGIVSDVMTDIGIDVSLGTPIIKLVDISTVGISITVPEGEIGSMKIGQEALVEVPALNIEGLKAEVVTKGVVASALSHSYECILKLTEPVKGLMPGMVSKVRIINNSPDNGIHIPASAVETDVKGRFVWTVKEGTVHKTFVEVAGYMGNGVKIASGIDAGDMIIVQGSAKVSTGMKVETSIVTE